MKPLPQAPNSNTALSFSGELTTLLPGLTELAKAGAFRLAPGNDGLPVRVLRGTAMAIRCDGTTAVIRYKEKCQFFRLLGLLLEHLGEGAFTIQETPNFDKCGVMLDASRNAVMKPTAFYGVLRRMALMGLNTAMLYTEDTYTLPSQPYFGYMRGRYTAEELRACDDYADLFGIELIPCIQTLGHLGKALRWQFATEQGIKDTADILLAGEENTLAFLEQMLTAASAPFRSNRIHLGMDEAQGLGSGRYLEKNGYKPSLEILRAHLAAVMALCRKLSLDPMIWSDMCLRPLSPVGDYYDADAPLTALPEAVTDSVPTEIVKEIALVYWDYYHDDKATYDKLLAKHAQFPNRTIFAGGAWTWNGLVPNCGKAYIATEAGLTACKQGNIREVFCTAWGDNGGETNLQTALLCLQQYAEHMYEPAPTLPAIFRRFAACCGGNGEDFYALRLFDETPGVPKNNPNWCNPSKYLLYQEVLNGLFDRHIAGLPLNAWYRDLAGNMQAAQARNPAFANLFAFYAALAQLLAVKAELGVQLHAAYRAKDTVALRQLAATCTDAVPLVDALGAAWDALWHQTYKAFGYEVIDMRLGALKARLTYAAKQLARYTAGELASIEELEAEQLYFDGRPENDTTRSAMTDCALWDLIVSANPISTI